MTTAGLLVLDLVVAIAAAGSWTAAAVVAWPLVSERSARGALVASVLSAAGVVATVGHLALVGMLATRGWWFAQDQLALGAPLLAVAAIAAVVGAAPSLTRMLRGRGTALPRRVPVLLLAAGVAGGVCVVSRMGIGYPLDPVPAIVLLVLAALLTGTIAAVRWAARSRVIAAWSGIAAIVLVTSVGLGYLGSLTAAPMLQGGHAHGGQATAVGAGPVDLVSVADLRTSDSVDAPVRSFTLIASAATVELASGATVEAFSYDGTLPGPELRVTEGDLVDVTLVNDDIADGVTVHWHGVDLPNAEDGVAGVTQDAVRPGDSFHYRFVAEDPGTYWYHTHQASSDGVQRGLYGTLVVVPAAGIAEQLDLVVPMHTFDGRSVFGDSDIPSAQAVEPGTTVRLRIIDTDQAPLTVQLDPVAFRVVAVDGRELVGGPSIEQRSVRLPAGGRVDLAFTMPDTPVTVTRDGLADVSLTLSPDGAVASAAVTAEPELDLLAYDATSATTAPAATRHLSAEMVLDRLPRALNGLPAYGYTVNGEVAPHIPEIVVEPGDALTLTVVNRGWETHPMHIHGHHVRVISRDGVAATAQLWLDTFDVQPGEVWVVELYADNPGVWMDHCHNLDHAAAGMMMALSYRGVVSPFELGGTAGNRPE